MDGLFNNVETIVSNGDTVLLVVGALGLFSDVVADDDEDVEVMEESGRLRPNNNFLVLLEEIVDAVVFFFNTTRGC